MAITSTTLTRAAGLSAVIAGLIFAGVQINHPPLDLALVSTVEWQVRQSLKIVMAVFALVGITGMYLSQVRRNGVLGLIGYLVLGTGYLAMLSVEVAGLVILPAIAQTSPAYVSDVLAVAGGGHAVGDVGLLASLNVIGGAGYMLGGLILGIALFRANVLARWAAILLSVATISSAAIPLLPMVNQRLFAVPTGVALVGLGYSLWRQHRRTVTAGAGSVEATRSEPAVVR